MNSYEHTSRDFLPLSVIRSACAGDTDAVEQVLRHYRGYINKLIVDVQVTAVGRKYKFFTRIVVYTRELSQFFQRKNAE